jgi:hypothetical protein
MKKNELIAYKDNIITNEDLPICTVLYPGFYGAFFAFEKENNIYLCECSKIAVKNYIKLKLSNHNNERKCFDAEKNFILDSRNFPIKFVESLINKKVEQNLDLINHVSFLPKICHECNKTVPKHRYCHEMYGGIFKQTYGWYIKKQAFEMGIESNKSQYKIAENEVRLKLDFKKVGEAWSSETLVYNLVKDLYPNYTIHFHYRPKFLNRLEIDVYIEELKIGIEYQGIQHYKPIEHFGGKKTLKKTKERDNCKKVLCSENGIKVVYINFDEQITKELIQLKLKS